MSRVIVIGGGLGGLAAAIRLAGSGRQVTLIEKNRHLGGKMKVLRDQGFVFDMGPTILTMPQVYDRLFESVGRRRADYLSWVRIEPQWRAFFEDRTVLDLHGDPAAMERELAKIAPDDAANYRAFLRHAERKYHFSEKFFFWRSLSGMRDVIDSGDLTNWDGLKTLWEIDPWSHVADAVGRHFRDPRIRQLFEHFLQYVGSSPHQAPAILCAIHHIQLAFGVWYPMGGTGRVAVALEKLARELGVEFRLGQAVTGLHTRGDRIVAAQVGGERVEAESFIANSDFVKTHERLLPQSATHQTIRTHPKRFEPSCSGVVFYFGLDQKYDQLRHHDFFFSRDPIREFDDIYIRKIPTQDPTLGVCVPSRTDPSVAPVGCENLYVLVHTPYLQGNENWERISVSYRELILDKLERNGLGDLRRHIRVEHKMTPHHLEEWYWVNRGAIYGIASHGRLRGGFKPANRSAEFRNLYFCGGSVNPGSGTPMAVMSGQVAADCLLADSVAVVP